MARGSVKKHVGARGVSWYAVVDIGDDPATGKRKQKRVSAATRRECERLVTELVQAVETGAYVDAGKTTVAAYLDRWLGSLDGSLRPASIRRYRDVLRLNVVPIVGAVPLAKLTALDVQRVYANRLAAGLSPTTVNQLHNILHKALKQAVRWGLLIRNPTEQVDAPQPVNPETTTWDARQVAAVLRAASDDDLEALWRLALLCGLRRGELLALAWSDVDLDRASLSVRRTLSRGEGGLWTYGAPKTNAGRRSIALPASVVESLRRHRIRQLERRLLLGTEWQGHDHDRIFTNDAGAPLLPNPLVRRFRQLVKRAGVPTIRIHDMRHTSATLMLANGEHPRIVQERLGHADVSTTLNRYSHVTPDMQRDAADRLDAVIEKATEAAS